MGRLRFRMGLVAVGLCAGLATTAGATSSVSVDLVGAAAALDLEADTDGNGAPTTELEPNGILDFDEFALIEAILANTSLDLTGTGGLDHDSAHAAFTQAVAAATTDLGAFVLSLLPGIENLVAAYAMLGSDSFDAIAAFVASEGAGPLVPGSYSLAVALDPFLAPDGDADGDTFTNLQEYNAFKSVSTAAWVAAALDPTVALRVTNVSGGGFTMTGDPLVLSATIANTSGGETFQWQVNKGSGFMNVTNTKAITGATTPTLTINPAADSDSGNYKLVVTGSFGPVESSSVPVFVALTPPVPANDWVGLALLCGMLLAGGVVVQRKVRRS